MWDQLAFYFRTIDDHKLSIAFYMSTFKDVISGFSPGFWEGEGEGGGDILTCNKWLFWHGHLLLSGGKLSSPRNQILMFTDQFYSFSIQRLRTKSTR